MAQFELVVNQVNFDEEEITQNDELKCFGDLYSCDTDLLESNSSDSFPIAPKRVNIVWDEEKGTFVREDKILSTAPFKRNIITPELNQKHFSSDSFPSNGDSFKSFTATTDALALQKSFIGLNKNHKMDNAQISIDKDVSEVPGKRTSYMSHGSYTTDVSLYSNTLGAAAMPSKEFTHVSSYTDRGIGTNKEIAETAPGNLTGSDAHILNQNWQISSNIRDDKVQQSFLVLNRSGQSTPVHEQMNSSTSSLNALEQSLSPGDITRSHSQDEKKTAVKSTINNVGTINGSPADAKQPVELIRVPKESITVVKERTVKALANNNNAQYDSSLKPFDDKPTNSVNLKAARDSAKRVNTPGITDSNKQYNIEKGSSNAFQHIIGSSNRNVVLFLDKDGQIADVKRTAAPDSNSSHQLLDRSVECSNLGQDEKLQKEDADVLDKSQVMSPVRNTGYAASPLLKSVDEKGKTNDANVSINQNVLLNSADGTIYDLSTMDGLQMELKKVKKEKARLEGQLEVMQSELQGTLAERSALQAQSAMLAQKLKVNEIDMTELGKDKNLLEIEVSKLRQDRDRLEQAVLESHRSKEQKDAEIVSLEDDLQLTKTAHEKLQTKAREMKQDVVKRDSIIQEMKQKIAELYVQCQTAEQNKLLVEGELKAQRSELNNLRTSKEWHRSQLDKAQEAKAELRKEITKLKGDLVMQATAAERLKAESTRAKGQLADVQERALRDKEALARHLEAIEADIVENEAAFALVRQERDALLRRLQQLGDSANQNVVESQVSELEDKLRLLDHDLRQAKQQLASTERNQSEVAKRLLLSQEAIMERDKAVFDMEQRCREMEGRLGEMKSAVEEAKNETKRVEEAKMAADQELAAIKEEKQMFDGALNTFRSDMAKVEASFRALKQELATKTQEIEELKAKERTGAAVLEQNNLPQESSVRIVSNGNVPDVLPSSEQDANRIRHEEMQTAALRTELEKTKSEYLQLKCDYNASKDELIKLRAREAELDSQLHHASLEQERLVSQLANYEAVKTSQFLTSVQPDKTKEYVDQILREKVEREKQLEQVWREKVEREKQLQELSQQAAVQVEWFKAHMAAAEKRIAELNSLAQSQEIVKHDTGLEELEVLLEKERSKLAGVLQAHATLKDHTAKLEAHLASREALSAEMGSGVHREMQKRERLINDLQEKVKSMQVELDREKQVNKEMKKQLMIEKAAVVKARRELEEMWTTQDQLQTELDVLKRGADGAGAEKSQIVDQLQHTKDELIRLTAEYQTVQTQLETLQRESDESRVRETLLQEKIETQDWLMNNKTLETEGLSQQLTASEERHKKEVESLLKRIQALTVELSTLKDELASARAAKTALQTQAAELKTALQSLLNQNKGGAENELPFSSNDLNRLLQNAVTPSVQPGQHRSLNFLHSTLAGLRSEISSLQMQMEEHSSAVQSSRQAWSELENHVQELRSLCQTSAADRVAGDQLVAEGQKLLSAHASNFTFV